MSARVGHRAGVAVAPLADVVIDMMGDLAKGPPASDKEGLAELGARFYNDTGGELTKGTLVRKSSYSSKRAMTVAKSQAGVSVAQWVVAEDTANGAFGYVVKGGAFTSDLDTSGSSVGSAVYASAVTAGALTLTATAQQVGLVGSVSASGGDGIVLFDLWASGATSVGGSLNILDTGTLTYGTGGTDVVHTADGTDEVVTGTGDVVFADNMDLQIGTGKDLKIVHNGTDTLIAGANGDIVIDNTDVNDVVIIRVGTDTTATGIEFRNNSDAYMWKVEPTSATAGRLMAADGSALIFGTGADISLAWDGTDLLVTQALADSIVKWGVDGAGINHIFYGDTAARTLTWDQTNDQLLFADNTLLAIGSGAGAAGDITFSWNGTKMLVGQLTANSAIDFGVDGAGIDLVLYGDTASANITWDQSADKLILSGVAKIQCQTIAAATGTAIPVTHSGSFPITQNGAETNTLADPTFIGQWLSIFVDTDTSGARVITAASRINQAGNTIITLTEVGDFIKLEAITIAGALKWQVVANDGAVLS